MIQERNEVELQLSLTEKFEDIVSDVQKEIMNEELSEFPQIKENDINISTVYVFDDGDEIEAKIYFRNGFSQKVNFEYLPLIMINSKGEVLASKNFDLREMGDIPSGGARPWKVYFKKDSVDMDKFSPQDCKVIFNKNVKAVTYANIELEKFPENLTQFKPAFESFLAQLAKIEKGTFSVSTFNIAAQENGQIIVIILMRNASENIVKIEQIPVTIKDKDNNTIVSGKFELKDFNINSMKARICNLAFDTNLEGEMLKNTEEWKIIFE